MQKGHYITEHSSGQKHAFSIPETERQVHLPIEPNFNSLLMLSSAMTALKIPSEAI